jgi:hypothetical protein
VTVLTVRILFFFPVTVPYVYQAPACKPVTNNDELIQLGHLLREYNIKNYIAKIRPVGTHINVDLMRQLTHDYYDKQICDLIEYGFPLYE